MGFYWLWCRFCIFRRYFWCFVGPAVRFPPAKELHGSARLGGVGLAARSRPALAFHARDRWTLFLWIVKSTIGFWRWFLLNGTSILPKSSRICYDFLRLSRHFASLAIFIVWMVFVNIWRRFIGFSNYWYFFFGIGVLAGVVANGDRCKWVSIFSLTVTGLAGFCGWPRRRRRTGGRPPFTHCGTNTSPASNEIPNRTNWLLRRENTGSNKWKAPRDCTDPRQRYSSQVNICACVSEPLQFPASF